MDLPRDKRRRSFNRRYSVCKKLTDAIASVELIGVKMDRLGNNISLKLWSWSRSGFIPGGRICVCDHETLKQVFGRTMSNCALRENHLRIKRNLQSPRPLSFAKFSSSNEWFLMIFIFGILVFKKVRQ